MTALFLLAFTGLGPAFGQSISSDLDGDKDIDGKDLALFINAYINYLPAADLNKDSSIDALDLAKFSEVIGYVNTWSDPQQVFEYQDVLYFYDDMVRGTDGTWHFLFIVDVNNRLALRYTNTLPGAAVSTLVDLPKCDAGGCLPGQILDLFGSIAIGPDGRLHMVYNTDAEDEDPINPAIYYMHQTASDTWSQPQLILSNFYIEGFTVDTAGNWHLLASAPGFEVYSFYYTNSATLPSATLMVEFNICQGNLALCGQPGYIFDVNGKGIAVSPDGPVYVAVGIESDLSGTNNKILLMSRTPEGAWSSPQPILDQLEGGRVTAITADSNGNWHLLYSFHPFRSPGGDWVGRGIKYTNSLKFPQSEILVEYEDEYSSGDPPGAVTDLSGETISVNAEGDFHVGYGITIEDTVGIMQMVKSD